MLAGAQLGITLCTLGLGALAEPAIEHLLSPVLHARRAARRRPATSSRWSSRWGWSTFLHLVVGEMAPKSWAITDAERSATLLALPFRAFARVARPVLSPAQRPGQRDAAAGRGQPQDQLAQVHGPDELRILLEQSREHGLLGAEQHQMLTSMLELQGTTVAQVMEPFDQIVTVHRDDTAERIEQVSRDSGRSRLAVLDGGGEVCGLVHVREAVRAVTTGRAATAGELMSRSFTLPATSSVTEAVAAMRADQAQLALVRNGGGPTRPIGFVALEDLLEEVIGEFDDETDPMPRGRRLR